jgi:hypothetical protein
LIDPIIFKAGLANEACQSFVIPDAGCAFRCKRFHGHILPLSFPVAFFARVSSRFACGLDHRDRAIGNCALTGADKHATPGMNRNKYSGAADGRA